MATIRRALKLLLFGAILLVLSAAYRFFGEKKTDSEKFSPFGTKEAKADTYSQGGYGGGGCEGGCASGDSVCDGAGVGAGAGSSSEGGSSGGSGCTGDGSGK